MEEAVYKIRSLKHSYGGKTVLSIDRLTIRPASIVGLVGPNGSGKSTLLRLLGLIEKPAEGKIYFNGCAVEPFSQAGRFQITLLPQEPFLMRRSVFKNVSYGLTLRGDSVNGVERVGEALAMVGLSSKKFSRRPWYALSGGEAQRVALAARLVLKPKVLLLDEPTASVDAASTRLIREASLKVRQELDTTVIVASHDRQWLYEICDEVLHMVKGRVFEKAHENIIFGPWTKLGPDLWGKKLFGRQYIKIPSPPNEDAAAVLDGLSFCGEDEAKDDRTIVLRGIVTRFNLERNSGRLFATVFVENQAFTLGVTPQQAEGRTVFPGKTVSICYDPDRIKWI